jgi:hypothetical protein
MYISVPANMSVSRIIPIHKKGKAVGNYSKNLRY